MNYFNLFLHIAILQKYYRTYQYQLIFILACEMWIRFIYITSPSLSLIGIPCFAWDIFQSNLWRMIWKMQTRIPQNNMKDALIPSSPIQLNRVWFYFFILRNFNHVVPKDLLLAYIKFGVLMTEDYTWGMQVFTIFQ